MLAPDSQVHCYYELVHLIISLPWKYIESNYSTLRWIVVYRRSFSGGCLPLCVLVNILNLNY